jgi:hypothetical protein
MSWKKMTTYRALLQVFALLLLAACAGNYQGPNTLENYPNKSTLESEEAKNVLLKAIGFWDKDKDTQLVSSEHMVEIAAFLYTGLHTKWVHDVDARSNNIRPTGPFVDGIGYNTHQRVMVYYSNGVVDWLLKDREGDIPDGAMIVKQMYPTDPNDQQYPGNKVTGWAVMIRDGQATKDGWLWFLFFLPGTPSFGSPVLLSQYGMSYCLACHAGADNEEGTYAYIGNLDGKGAENYEPPIIPTPPGPASDLPKPLATHGSQPSSFGLDVADIGSLGDTMHAHQEDEHDEMKLRRDKHLGSIPDALFGLLDNYIQDTMSKPVSPPLKDINPAIVEAFGNRKINHKSLLRMPWDIFTGHTVASPDELKNFITSDNCRGCHDASLLLGGRQPSMTIYKETGDPETPEDKYNLSIYGEWGTSMMALAGRDPFFHAQLESEHALRPELKDWTSDLCLSCHQVAGQRQFHMDNNEDKYYTAEHTYQAPDGKHLNPNAEYGALGRDGVTCTVCHQIVEDGLGTPATFTGKFNINQEPGKVFGPYQDDDIKPYYMKQALGIEPTHGEQIKNPALCGSCHTISLPVLEVGAKQPPASGGHESLEQTTYLEWLNSDYVNDPDATCQACHMPNYFRDEKSLEFIIANVEDGHFPQVGNRAEDSLITPEPKSEYRRHTLVGLSIVANRMFQQFPRELGIATLDPGTALTFGPASLGAVHRLKLTEDEMEIMADSTALLSASILSRDADKWRVQVNVENKAGHKFPSGVGFRRAFLEVTALSSDGTVLWGSGQTNAAGVIVDGSGQVLPSEFPDTWEQLEPDYGDGVISHQNQVQVFETRHINKDMKLTTSFLGLDKEMKDNRLLPKGWSKKGQYAEQTQLLQLGGEPMFPSNPGSRNIEYHIPAAVGDIDQVQVRLLYQATPPYYLRDRFATAGPETDRLYYLTSHLDLKGSRAENWSVEISKVVAR